MKLLFLVIVIPTFLISCTRLDTPINLESSGSSQATQMSFSTGDIRSISSDTSSGMVAIGDTWKEVNHQNFWHNPQVVAGGDYLFPNISIHYPNSWEFECCGDSDVLSFHLLYPKGENPWRNTGERNFLDVPTNFPSITIMSKMGDKVFMGGTRDNPIYMTRDEYLDSHGINNDVSTSIPNWRIKRVIGTYPDFIDYIVKTDDGLVTFRFNNRKLFKSGFEEKFMSLIDKSE